MFGKPKVRVDKDLLIRARRYAEAAGYSSVEELVAHALEKELARLDESQDEEEMKKRLRGLGYLS